MVCLCEKYLHDRTGRLEIGYIGNLVFFALHDRTGRLEIGLSISDACEYLHDRTGRLEMHIISIFKR